MNFREAKSKFIKRSLICSIIAILVCWFMKLVGFDLFQLDLNNKFFNGVDIFFTNNEWLRQIYFGLTLYLNTYLITCIVNQESGKKIALYVLFTMPLSIGVRVLTSIFSTQLGMFVAIIEIVYLVLLCSKFNYKKMPRAFIIVMLTTIYQMISQNTRSLPIKSHTTGFVANQIMNIDYYIMLYLHKEVVIMNDGTWIFFGPTAWLYAVAGFITGIFKGHPIKNAKSWYSKGLLKEDVRKAEKASISLAKAK